MWRGAGERDFQSEIPFIIEFVSAAESSNNLYTFQLLLDANMAAIGYHWLPLPSSTFYAQFTRSHSTTRPNAIRTAYSSTLTNTDHHSSISRAQLARQHCCLPPGLSLVNIVLDPARCCSSPLRLRLTAATASPSRCPVHHLQMPRSSSAQLHCTEAATPPRIREHIVLCTRCVP